MIQSQEGSVIDLTWQNYCDENTGGRSGVSPDGLPYARMTPSFGGTLVDDTLQTKVAVIAKTQEHHEGQLTNLRRQVVDLYARTDPIPLLKARQKWIWGTITGVGVVAASALIKWFIG